ncbi:PAS domain S-box-containing protein/diguanylate cyclase (GGDEF)-like protein [Crenobacter luteus]|uniref:sensor domain-containing diguanylate cyclase n=1 Tax=Crenobacter luteus TaxID=1452487 RepID=UPI0010484F69|nr:sensor domain-containing diguanylate cyclase [Crenobacter luteus]TCP15515.1 PAS domain S-box-containing protein/diguanylate cyclase (GGDEF)-like protein [Crenobacter luteus]
MPITSPPRPAAGPPPPLRLERQLLAVVAGAAVLGAAWSLANGYLQQRARAERAEAAIALDTSLRTLETALAEQIAQLEDALPRGIHGERLSRLTGSSPVWRVAPDGSTRPLGRHGAPADPLTRELALRALGSALPQGELRFLPLAQAAQGDGVPRFAFRHAELTVGKLTPWPLVRPNWPARWSARIELKDGAGQEYGRFSLGPPAGADAPPWWRDLVAPGLTRDAPEALTIGRPLGASSLRLEARLATPSLLPAPDWLVALPLASTATAALLLALVAGQFRRRRRLQHQLDQLEQSHLLMSTSNGTLRERLKQLTASQRDLQTLLDTVQVGVLILDADHWQIRACNQRAGALFGCDANDLTGQSGERLFASDTDLSICRALIAQGMPVIDRDLCLKRLDGRPFWSLVSMRGLFHNGQPAVAISVVDVSERIAHAEQLQAEKQATEHAMRQLESAQAELVTLATLDDLTGIANRRHFMKSAGALLETALRQRAPFAVLMIDIDYFKRVNDTLGHDAGDAILSQTVALCRVLIRQHDVFGRLGGEEFCLALPESDALTALTIAERVRERVATHPFHAAGHTRQVTVSIGLAVWQPGGAPQTLAALLKAADEALYRAKADGRNRVACADGARPHDVGVH